VVPVCQKIPADFLNLNLPLLDSLGTSNKEHINHITHKIKNFGKKKIGFLGLTFKSDTDDLRESPLVLIARLLLDNGYDLKIYDTHLERDKLMGVNLTFLLEHLPEFESIMVESHRELTDFSELIVIGNRNHEYKYMVEFPKEEKIVFDLAGVLKEKEHELDHFFECLARI
jgi:GDP-mannose 6-dehydrogenase